MPSLKAHMLRSLVQRDITDDVTSIPQTFSSFSSCMSKTWCKVLFIAGCVIGAILLLTIIYCCWRCCCRGRRKRAPIQQEAPINYNAPAYVPPQVGNFNNQRHSSGNGAPQYAYFEDDLPVMPTWDGAKKERLAKSEEAVQAEEHELQALNTAGASKGSKPGGGGWASVDGSSIKPEPEGMDGHNASYYGNEGGVPGRGPGSNVGVTLTPNGQMHGQTYGQTSTLPLMSAAAGRPSAAYAGSQSGYSESAYSNQQVNSINNWEQQQQQHQQQPIRQASPYQAQTLLQNQPDQGQGSFYEMPARQASPYQHSPVPIRAGTIPLPDHNAYIPQPTSPQFRQQSHTPTPYPDEAAEMPGAGGYPQYGAPLHNQHPQQQQQQGWPAQQRQQQMHHQTDGGYAPYEQNNSW